MFSIVSNFAYICLFFNNEQILDLVFPNFLAISRVRFPPNFPLIFNPCFFESERTLQRQNLIKFESKFYKTMVAAYGLGRIT
jgi:hypothetical protein